MSLGIHQAAALGPETVAFPVFSLADLQADYDQFRRIVETQHPQLYADRAELQAALNTGRTELREGMSELAFYRLLAGLTRRLNCGHTGLSLSQSTAAAVDAQRRLLPLAIKIAEGRLFVVRARTEAAALVGAEIVAINGQPASMILQGLYDGMTADGANLTRKQHFLNGRFASYYHLLVDTSSQFSVEYRDAHTRLVATGLLDGISSAEWNELRDPTVPDDDGLGSTSFAADHAVLWVSSFNFYDAAGHTRFYAFVDRFFDEVRARGLSRVILDLRGNGGGDPYCGAYLFRRLISRAQPYFATHSPYYADLKVALTPAANAFTGELCVLIDGGSFSTTGHFSSLLRYHQIGTFLGEESGGSFACTAATQSSTLIFSRLRFSYSTNTFTTAVSGLTPGRGIAPDYPVAPTAQHWIDGSDPVKALAQRLLGRGAAAAMITRQPASITAAAGGDAHFSLQTIPSALHAWEFNGATLVNGDVTDLEIGPVSRSHAGIYSAFVTANGQSRTTRPAILGYLGTGKAEGGREVGPNVVHVNGNTYDQVLAEEASVAVTADPHEVTRISFVDLQDDIVQVEFSGAGTLVLTLDAASGPASPIKYEQHGVRYLKGHARIVIAGADETSNLTVFSVGRANAWNQALFRPEADYDGWADIGSIAILSANGKFGSIRAGNAIFSGTRGHVGIVAPDVQFTGPIVIGDLHAADDAWPALLLGAAAAVGITGGDLLQPNGRAVDISGFPLLDVLPGTDSHNRSRARQRINARFEEDGIDVTSTYVPPGS